DGAGEPGAGVGLVGKHRRGGRLQEDVIECERFLKQHRQPPRGENKTGGPLGGRRVGEPLYTSPRINQVGRQSAPVHKVPMRRRGNPVSRSPLPPDARLRTWSCSGNRSSAEP